MEDFLLFLMALGFSFALTPVNIHLSRMFGFVDIPKDNRRMHNKPIATVGGVSIFLASVAAMALFGPRDAKLWWFLGGALVIVMTGIVDDRWNLPPKVKLLLQIAAAILPVVGGYRIQVLSNPFVPGDVWHLGWIGIAFSIVWIVGIVNALNFVDGMDGLSCGLAAISAFTFALATKSEVLSPAMSLVLAGSCLGFLPYNFHPAKIFMGDTGAMFLGYTLALISIDGVLKSVATMSLLVPVFFLALPVFDTLFAIIRRTINKKGIMSADKGHLHHRIVARGYSVPQTVLMLYALSGLFSTIGILISKIPPGLALILTGLMFVMIVVLGVIFGMFKKDRPQGHTDKGGIH